jgi:hypothetical protein
MTTTPTSKQPITNARLLLGLDGFGPVTIEDWRSLGPSVARALVFATDDIDRLTAELEDARTELANERGEGEPPVEGWLWDPSFKQWELVVDGKGVGFVSRGYQTRWAWEVHVGRRSFHGYAPTARAAIRGTT